MLCILICHMHKFYLDNNEIYMFICYMLKLYLDNKELYMLKLYLITMSYICLCHMQTFTWITMLCVFICHLHQLYLDTIISMAARWLWLPHGVVKSLFSVGSLNFGFHQHWSAWLIYLFSFLINKAKAHFLHFQIL